MRKSRGRDAELERLTGEIEIGAHPPESTGEALRKLRVRCAPSFPKTSANLRISVFVNRSLRSTGGIG